MHANINVFPSAAVLLDCLRPLDLRKGIPSREKLSPNSEVQTSEEVVGLDAYKIAVLVSVAAAILSLCL